MVLFIGLKLTGLTDWSWWWVLSPVWVPFALIGVIFGVALVGVGITEWRTRRRFR